MTALTFAHLVLVVSAQTPSPSPPASIQSIATSSDVAKAPVPASKAHTDVVASLAVTADGKTLMSGSGDDTNSIKVWSLPDGALTKTLAGTPGAVMTLTPKGLEDVETLGHSKIVRFLTVTRDGRTLASGSMDNRVKVWQVQTGKLLGTIRGARSKGRREDEYVGGAVMTPDGKVLVYSDFFGIHLVRTLDRTLIAEADTGGAIHPLLAVSKNGNFLAVGCDDCYPESNSRKLSFWSLPGLKLLAEVDPQDYETRGMDFAPDGKSLVTAGREALRIWSVPDGKLLGTVPNERRVYDLVVSPRGDSVVAAFDRGGGSDVVQAWSLPDGRILARFEMPPPFDSATSLAFGPDGTTLLVGGSNGHIAVWDLQTRTFGKYLADPVAK